MSDSMSLFAGGIEDLDSALFESRSTGVFVIQEGLIRSVNPMFVKAIAPFACEIVIVRRLIPPERTVVGFHDFATAAAWLTARFAAAAKALLP